jgi:pimeloyl-ACP methyl ester carboxylesterase
VTSAAVLFAASAGSAAAAPSDPLIGGDHGAHGAGGPKPTIVLVHGAWGDSSGFGAEIADLAAMGYPVVAVADPLRGLSSDAAYLRARLATISGPIVLVGHSYGGAVITDAAVGMPGVKALVYVAAFGLAPGESVVSMATAYPAHIDPSKFDEVPIANPAAPGGQDVDIYLKSADFADIMAADVPAPRAALEAVTQRPAAGQAFNEASGTPAWATIPSWYLITLDDHAVSPAGQEFMARRMHARVETVHSAHDVEISHPRAVEDVILDAAAHT